MKSAQTTAALKMPRSVICRGRSARRGGRAVLRFTDHTTGRDFTVREEGITTEAIHLAMKAHRAAWKAAGWAFAPPMMALVLFAVLAMANKSEGAFPSDRRVSESTKDTKRHEKQASDFRAFRGPPSRTLKQARRHSRPVAAFVSLPPSLHIP